MGIEKHSERKEKKSYCNIKCVLAFRNSDLNSNSSPRANISSSFTCGFMFDHIWNPC